MCNKKWGHVPYFLLHMVTKVEKNRRHPKVNGTNGNLSNAKQRNWQAIKKYQSRRTPSVSLFIT